jgi:hypothetical protein
MEGFYTGGRELQSGGTPCIPRFSSLEDVGKVCIQERLKYAKIAWGAANSRIQRRSHRGLSMRGSNISHWSPSSPRGKTRGFLPRLTSN